jgi:hypothetical protein
MRFSVTRTALALAVTIPLALAAPASASVFTVTNTNDPGPGSLRQAIINANASPGHDDIVFAGSVTGTITLTAGELSVQSDLSIAGPGPTSLTVSGNKTSRVFNISSQPPGVATISGLTIADGFAHADDGGSGGDAGASGGGGAIFNQGSLALNNVQVSGSRIEGGNGANGNRFHSGGPGGNGMGGGIYSTGTLTLTNALIAGNTAHGGFGGDAPGTVTLHAGEGGSGWGGGIYAEGVLRATNVRVAGNVAAGGEGGNSIPDFSRGRRGGEGNGGGIAFNGTDALLRGLTAEANTARGGPGPFGGWAYGGGIRTDLGRGNIEIHDSSVSNNQALGGDGAEEPRPQHVQGGGILTRDGSLTMEGSTISGNSVRGGSKHNDDSTIAGGGLDNLDGGNVDLLNSTITGNTAEVGGGVDNRNGDRPRVFMTSVTIADNAASGSGGNVANFEPDKGVVFDNTIVGSSRGAAASCAGGQNNFSFGYNLDQGSSCGLKQPTDLRNKDPQLGDLGKNGGPTRTMAIPRSSPALDQGHRSGLFFDQRALKRPVSFDVQRPPGGDGSDIGAFEIQGTAAAKAVCGGRRASIVVANIGRARGTKRRDVIDGTRRGVRVGGRSAGDRICGRLGNDDLRGQRGGDRIWGNRGGDVIAGGPGADTIRDLDGRNEIRCGAGRDRVVTNGRSRVAADCERVRRAGG